MGEYTPNEPNLKLLKPTFVSSPDFLTLEKPKIQSTIKALDLVPHVEGGYYKQTDASPMHISSPYPLPTLSSATASLAGLRPDYDPFTRRLSTTIFYYLTPCRPQGTFHRNRSRIIHTLHRGRGRYVLIHPGGQVETFIVGQNVEEGEKLQWVVEGNVWKASYLLESDKEESEGLLISETVVPGFEYADHEFLTGDIFGELLPEDKAKELSWLVRKDE